MSRTTGKIKYKLAETPKTLVLSPKARLAFLANLIVDKIEQDKRDDYPLLKKLEAM
jgi:hypothetical protein